MNLSRNYPACRIAQASERRKDIRMIQKTNRRKLVLAAVFAVGCLATAYATSGLLTQFDTLYGTAGTVLDSCSTCHTSPPTLNPYGNDLANSGNNFQAIENLDSDGDGFTNLVEIRAGTNPGDPNSHPSVTGPDTVPPTVTAFAIPATSSSLTIPITTFTATDDVGVTGYMVTESATAPVPADPGWMASPPTSYTFSSAGTKTLYAWAKDAAGNVSASMSATITVTTSTGGGGGGTDTTPPTVTSFTLPATSTSRRVKILSFTATDDVGVTGYQVTHSSMSPSPASPRWRSKPPTSYTLGEEASGMVTLWAWAVDAAGNVSAGASATVDITGSGGGGGCSDDGGSNDGGTTTRHANGGDAEAGMDLWSGQWFAVTTQSATTQNASGSGFLKLQSWDPELSQFQATLFTLNPGTGRWQSSALTLKVASGNAGSFLSSFDYEGILQFSASVSATISNGNLQSATIGATGIATARPERDASATRSVNPVSVTGKWIAESEVPVQILH